jgi:hypothetical protein
MLPACDDKILRSAGVLIIGQMICAFGAMMSLYLRRRFRKLRFRMIADSCPEMRAVKGTWLREQAFVC